MTASAALLSRICPGCDDSVPRAVTASGRGFYLGWICRRCLGADRQDSLLDILGVYAACGDADGELLCEEYCASVGPAGP